RGQRNEPAFVVHTAETLAAVKGLDVAALHDKTSENFFRLFSRAVPPAKRPAGR
ncbi:MAG: LuxR family transcriptional regulator, partial [Rhodospirillaceae bacterium]|nr:LuxR family transcriptional regulator [Rhodospirillaceae bacterium]